MTLETITYHDGDTALTGWLARPQGTPRAAFVIYPTIMNPNEPMERRAQMLADAGYLALVADFYGETPRDFDHSRQLADALRGDVDGYRRRIGAAVSALRERAGELRLGAVGYCMGGQAALEAARAGEDLAFVASFHGILATDRPATAQTPIAARIFISHGDADPLVPRSQVLAFWEEMDAAGANWHFHAYSAVKHGFTEPGSDSRGLPALGYDASADHQSWNALLSLIAEIYG